MSSVPPPPPPTPPPQGPPPMGQPLQGQPSFVSPPPPPGFQGYTPELAGRAPRPQVRVGAALMIGGAIVHAIAVFLPWFTYEGQTLNGRDDFLSKDLKVIQAPGNFWLFFAAILLGLGIALFVAGRNLAVAIIAVVFSTITVFFSLIGIGAASSTKDAVGGGRAGFGAVLGILAALVALGGSITVLAKRRR